VISELNLNKLTYWALFCLCISLFMGTSLLAGFHILLIIPILFSLKDLSVKKLSWSQIFFLLFGLFCLLSVFVNQDIETRGYSPMTKAKYYFIAVLGILPMQKAFDQYINTDRRLKMFKGFLIFSVVASLAGLIALYTQVNPFTFKKACHESRNCGMSGMYMNYAHSLNYLMALLFAMIVYGSDLKKYFHEKFFNVNLIYVIFIFQAIAFYLSFTRGAWLGFLASIPFAFYKKKKSWVIGGVLAIILFGAFAYFFIPKVQETFTSRQASNDERVGSWRAAIKAFEERPILGFGMLNFEPHSGELKVKYHLNNAYFKGHAHNIFLEFLSTTGILGFSAFLLWLIFWIKEMLNRSDLISNLAIPLIVAFIVGGLTQSTFVLAENTFFITGFYMLTQIKWNQTHE
jgi:O-antigen ligase